MLQDKNFYYGIGAGLLAMYLIHRFNGGGGFGGGATSTPLPTKGQKASRGTTG